MLNKITPRELIHRYLSTRRTGTFIYNPNHYVTRVIAMMYHGDKHRTISLYTYLKIAHLLESECAIFLSKFVNTFIYYIDYSIPFTSKISKVQWKLLFSTID